MAHGNKRVVIERAIPEARILLSKPYLPPLSLCVWAWAAVHKSRGLSPQLFCCRDGVLNVVQSVVSVLQQFAESAEAVDILLAEVAWSCLRDVAFYDVCDVHVVCGKHVCCHLHLASKVVGNSAVLHRVEEHTDAGQFAEECAECLHENHVFLML